MKVVLPCSIGIIAVPYKPYHVRTQSQCVLVANLNPHEGVAAFVLQKKQRRGRALQSPLLVSRFRFGLPALAFAEASWKFPLHFTTPIRLHGVSPSAPAPAQIPAIRFRLRKLREVKAAIDPGRWPGDSQPCALRASGGRPKPLQPFGFCAFEALPGSSVFFFFSFFSLWGSLKDVFNPVLEGCKSETRKRGFPCHEEGLHL